MLIFPVVYSQNLRNTMTSTRTQTISKIHVIRQSDNFSNLPECMGPASKKEVTNSIIPISWHNYLFSCMVMKNNNERVYSTTTVYSQYPKMVTQCVYLVSIHLRWSELVHVVLTKCTTDKNKTNVYREREYQHTLIP